MGSTPGRICDDCCCARDVALPGTAHRVGADADGVGRKGTSSLALAATMPPPEAPGRPPRHEKGRDNGMFYGVQPNRACACCGSAMEQNTASYSCGPNEYCTTCGREPLCGACTWPIRLGDLRAEDERWTRLTQGRERRWEVECCRCRGVVDEEHQNPEQPLPIASHRPCGWLLCPWCTPTIRTLPNGSRLIEYWCNRHHHEHHHRHHGSNSGT